MLSNGLLIARRLILVVHMEVSLLMLFVTENFYIALSENLAWGTASGYGIADFVKLWADEASE